MYIETMEVDRNGVKVVINKSDFNPAIEKLWADKAEKTEPEKKRKAGE